MIHVKRSLIIFNQWKSIINLDSQAPTSSVLTPSSGLLSLRLWLPFTLYSIFLTHCSTLHAPSELHYFSHSVVKGEGQQPEKAQYVIVSEVTKTSAAYGKSLGYACILKRKLTLNTFSPHNSTHSLSLSFCLYTHTHTHGDPVGFAGLFE